MKLWQLQIASVAFALAVGWGVSSWQAVRFPTPGKLRSMCSAPSDELARGTCAEISAR